ncbi:cellulose binding domain-containing protein [Sinosporangium siamense]|uniref:chitinase n=1 Tax=Sinosporangium siamense TaxID=1367973 RepID=A0A919V6X3_9ACTN|nr:cellulose binding domain-containing protein [Sinosporangium siamense]GII91472.1 chitinase [Sinosporangium siamense]
MRFVRFVVAAIFAAASLVVMTAPAQAASVTATFTKPSDWGSGFEGRYTIKNGTAAAITSWKVEFDLPAGHSVTSHWDATVTRTGQHVTFTNLGWNGNIPAGGTLTFGFLGTPGGAGAVPQNCKINGADCGGVNEQVPGKPGTPTFQPAGTTPVDFILNWTASSGTVTGYKVYEGTGTTPIATVNGTATTARISLQACGTYEIRVKGFNSAGESVASDPVTIQTIGCLGPPKMPTDLTSTSTSNSITLNWKHANSNGPLTGYKVYEGNVVKATVGRTATTATISGLGTCESHDYVLKAYNEVGESGPVTITAKTAGCPDNPLPRNFITGYWQNFTNPTTPLKLSQVPDDYDLIAIAFADATPTPGRVEFKLDPALSTALGGYTDAQFRADVKAQQAKGNKVIISVGGELGRVRVASAGEATAFTDSVWAIMQDYGFDGIDIDLENGLNATYMGQALKALRTKAGPSLIITMAPQTIDMQSTGMEYFKLALDIKDILTVVHMQFYNSGGMLGCDQAQAYSQGTLNFLTALACIQLENGLRPDQVALGVPAGPGAAGGGVINPSMVNNALDCLAKRTNCGTFVPPRAYPGIRGAMTWSINWDAQHNWQFSRTVKPHLATLP